MLEGKNPYIKEQQTQWWKENVQKEKQRSKKHIYKAKGRVARVSLKSWVNSGAPDSLVAPVVLM